MIRRRRTNKVDNQKAQTLLEYTLLIGIVVLILFAMNPLLKRGIQGMIKVVADEIGNQQKADQQFDERGHLAFSETKRSVDQRIPRLDKGGRVGRYRSGTQDTVTTETRALINLGFTERN